jgi:hypothetical protein
MNPSYDAGYYDTLLKLGMVQAAEMHLEKCAAEAGMDKEAFRQQAAKILGYLNPLKWFKGAPAGPTRGGGLGEALQASMQHTNPSHGGALGKAIQESIKTTGKTMPGAKPWTLGRKLKWGVGLGGAGLASYHLLGDQEQPAPPQPQQQYSDPYAQQGYY